MPLGPIYIVDGKGEIVGIEYMFTNEMLKEVSITTPAGIETFLAQTDLPVGTKVDHVDLSYAPHGHEGHVNPHYDIHMYLITPAQKVAISP